MFDIFCDICGAKINQNTEDFDMINEAGELKWHCERCIENEDR